MALAKDDKIKAIRANKKILKDQLIAGLGFLHNLNYDQAKETFRGIKVDDLQFRIVERYELLLPVCCNQCNKIYKMEDNSCGAQCFICDRRLCQDCCPELSSLSSFQITLFPICSVCVDPKVRSKSPNRGNLNIPETQGSQVEETPFTQPSQSTPTATPPTKKEEVCRYYIVNRCKHGWKGEGCTHNHPKLCMAYVNKGKCKKQDCIYYHPKACKNGDDCKFERCKYFHSKASRKIIQKKLTQDEPIIDNTESSAKSKAADNTNTNRDNTDSNTGSAASTNQDSSANNNSNTDNQKSDPPASGQGFQVPPTDTSQVLLTQLTKQMEEMTKNMSILMEERNQRWYWANPFQYHQS